VLQPACAQLWKPWPSFFLKKPTEFMAIKILAAAPPKDSGTKSFQAAIRSFLQGTDRSTGGRTLPLGKAL